VKVGGESKTDGGWSRIRCRATSACAGDFVPDAQWKGQDIINIW
jgi:hypothetical protein